MEGEAVGVSTPVSRVPRCIRDFTVYDIALHSSGSLSIKTLK